MTILTHAPLLLASALLSLPPAGGEEPDPRDSYDVLSYRLDLRVDPETETLSGIVAIEVRVLAPELEVLVLDLQHDLEPQRVRRPLEPLTQRSSLDGERLRFRHRDDLLSCVFPEPIPRGETVTVAVRYTGNPTSVNGFDGFHWDHTPSGAPWISTSCQSLGAHSWWPCKASFFNPDDKQERLFVNATVPRGLLAVSNGRLVSREVQSDGWETFRWRHDYPCETYSIALNVGPFEVVETELELRGIPEPVPFIYYVLPEDLEKARVQFAEVPRFLDVMAEAFGPWPFPDSKVGLVQTSFWGMEHSTAIAYGSSWPTWLAEHGGHDPYAGRNTFFDYILIHEMAHEWWGNAVSADDWGNFWIHEGFATYAEGVYVEHLHGREEADRFFAQQRRFTHPRESLFRGTGTNSRQAYNSVIYSKGAGVLNTLRHYIADDAAWWRALRRFNLEYRYRNAGTAEFQSIVEDETGRSWERFFEQWVYGTGFPELAGSARLRTGRIELEISNPVMHGTAFDVPLDLAWRAGDEWRELRIQLEPGLNAFALEVGPEARDLKILHLDRVLGRHDVRVLE